MKKLILDWPLMLPASSDHAEGSKRNPSEQKGAEEQLPSSQHKRKSWSIYKK